MQLTTMVHKTPPSKSSLHRRLQETYPHRALELMHRPCTDFQSVAAGVDADAAGGAG